MDDFIISSVGVVAWLTVDLIFLQLIYKKTDFFTKAPGLDWAMASFTLIPWFVCSYAFGWVGFAGCLVGQLVSLYGFNVFHGLTNRHDGPTIKHAINEIVGPTRNHLGLFVSLLACPGLWAIRFSTIFIYPLLRWTLKFPKYDVSEWVNVSRFKFEGLVGHDMVWCLYCDWMTGIYAYGGELLRNVESFWCPIRFYPDKKCDNCQLTFPDIKEWTPKDGTMEEVTNLLLAKYPPESKEPNGWFGHSDRPENKEKSATELNN